MLHQLASLTTVMCFIREENGLLYLEYPNLLQGWTPKTHSHYHAGVESSLITFNYAHKLQWPLVTGYSFLIYGCIAMCILSVTLTKWI